MNPQTAQIREARAFVDGALLECQLSVVSGQLRRTTDNGPLTALRECSICELPKPAAEFRQVIGRTTTEACGECCDRRDQADNSRDPLGPAAVAEFCLRVAMKRSQKALAHARATAPTMLLPRNGSQKKEKSALPRDPKEYAAKLQKFPERVAATIGKTYAVKGDACEIEDVTALIQIMDLVNDLDDTLIARNAKKRLARSQRSS